MKIRVVNRGGPKVYNAHTCKVNKDTMYIGIARDEEYYNEYSIGSCSGETEPFCIVMFNKDENKEGHTHIGFIPETRWERKILENGIMSEIENKDELSFFLILWKKTKKPMGNWWSKQFIESRKEIHGDEGKVFSEVQ